MELKQINLFCLQASASLRHIGFYCLPRDHHWVEDAVLGSGKGYAFLVTRRIEAALSLSGDFTDVLDSYSTYKSDLGIAVVIRHVEGYHAR